MTRPGQIADPVTRDPETRFHLLFQNDWLWMLALISRKSVLLIRLTSSQWKLAIDVIMCLMESWSNLDCTPVVLTVTDSYCLCAIAHCCRRDKPAGQNR